MAVELEKFIADQLGRLPKDHPDRRFMEEMLSRTNTHINKKDKKRVRLPSVTVNPTAQLAVDIFKSTQVVEAKQLRDTDPNQRRNPWGYTRLVSNIFIGTDRSSRDLIKIGSLRSHIIDVAYRPMRGEDNSELWDIIDSALNTLPEDMYTIMTTRYSLHERDDVDEVPMQAIGEACNPPLSQSQVNNKIKQTLILLRHPSRSFPIAQYIDVQPRNPRAFYAR